MNESLSVPAFLAHAGLSDAGDLAAVLWMLFAIAVLPFIWLSAGSWLSVFGALLLAADFAVAMVVGRPLFRLLHRRWRIPEWLVSTPLIPVVALAVAFFNFMVMIAAAKLLPNALFAAR